MVSLCLFGCADIYFSNMLHQGTIYIWNDMSVYQIVVFGHFYSFDGFVEVCFHFLLSRLNWKDAKSRGKSTSSYVVFKVKILQLFLTGSPLSAIE